MKTFGIKKDNCPYQNRQAVYAVIIKDKHVACIEGLNALFLIGGGINESENELEALYREVNEECSAAVKVVSSLPHARQYFYAESDGVYYDMKASFYLCEFSEKPQDTREHHFVWKSLDAIKSSLYHECHEWAIMEALPKISVKIAEN